MSLYKYLPPERLDVLRNLCIRFTQPGAQNDPFEFRPLINRFRRPEVARQAISKPLSEEWDRRLKQFGSEFVNEVERISPGCQALRKEAALVEADVQGDQASREEIFRELNPTSRNSFPQ